MSVDQRLIQVRSVDPLQEITSDGVNNKLKAIVSENKGVFSGFEFIQLTPTTFKVNPGICLKDYVTIKYDEAVTLEITSLGDGFHHIVLEYVYEKTIPLYIAEIKIVTPAEYTAEPAKYLYLGTLQIDLAAIVYLSQVYPADPSLFRRVLLTHNSYEDLQGGQKTTDEFYHLSEAEHTAVGSMVVPTGMPHNGLGHLEGGNGTDEFYHFIANEWSGIVAVMNDDQAAWHLNPLYIGGSFVNADKLGTKDATDLALAVHTHVHNDLNTIQGGVATERYHVDEQEHIDLSAILATHTVENTSKLGGRLDSDFALATHVHDHSGVEILSQQGGQANEYYHLSDSQLVTIWDIVQETEKFPNADKLNGHDSSYFALVGHVHSHNDEWTNLQGGQANEYYHLSAANLTFLQEVISGATKAPNANLLGGYDSSHFAQANHTHNHSNLLTIQGGISGQQYHLDADFYDALTNAATPTGTNYLLTGSDFSVGVLDHNDLTTIQGGSSTYRMHLTQAQHGSLSTGITTTLHAHSAYYRRSESDANYVNRTGDTLAALNLANHSIIGLAAPSVSTDLANKQYADSHLASAFDHNAVQDIQGGIPTEKYHFTLQQFNELTGVAVVSQHEHDGRYYTQSLSDTAFINRNGDMLTGTVNMSNNRVTTVPYASVATDIASKQYVEDNAGILPTASVLKHYSRNASPMTGKSFAHINKADNFFDNFTAIATKAFPTTPPWTPTSVQLSFTFSQYDAFSDSTIVMGSALSTGQGFASFVQKISSSHTVTDIATVNYWLFCSPIVRHPANGKYYVLSMDDGSGGITPSDNNVKLLSSTDLISWSAADSNVFTGNMTSSPLFGYLLAEGNYIYALIFTGGGTPGNSVRFYSWDVTSGHARTLYFTRSVGAVTKFDGLFNFNNAGFMTTINNKVSVFDTAGTWVDITASSPAQVAAVNSNTLVTNDWSGSSIQLGAYNGESTPNGITHILYSSVNAINVSQNMRTASLATRSNATYFVGRPNTGMGALDLYKIYRTTTTHAFKSPLMTNNNYASNTLAQKFNNQYYYKRS